MEEKKVIVNDMCIYFSREEDFGLVLPGDANGRDNCC